MRELMTEAAALLHVGERAAHELVRCGRRPAILVANPWPIERRAFEAGGEQGAEPDDGVGDSE